MKKILTLHFEHETNSFAPHPANEQAFRNSLFEVGEISYTTQKGLGTEFSAFLSKFADRDDVMLIPTVMLCAAPSAPVTEDVYDFVISEIDRAIEKHGTPDGVIMHLHGAMVAENHLDAEGDLLEHIRERVGYEIPIVASLDLHANITAKMARLATALVVDEEYPHIDRFETGLAAAEILEGALFGGQKPVMAYRRVPYLLPLFPTALAPIRPLYDLAHEIEEMPNVLCVRFSHGFFPSDIEELGMAVTVVTDGDKDLAETLAERLAKAIDEKTDQLKVNYISLEDALSNLDAEGEGPIVIADASDNPGAGGTNDTTHILRYMLENNVKGAAFACIADEESVKKCEEAGVGATVELSLGGKSDPAYSGGPLEVTAYVKAITDGKYINKGKMSHLVKANTGKTAVVEIGGNKVLISSIRKQPYDLEVYRSNGIEPKDQKILVVKSAVHYRADYSTVAREMHSVALGGYSNPLPEGYKYRRWKGKE